MPLPDPTRRAAEECARLASLPVQHAHAAGIDVGDSTHWVCVDSTPDDGDPVREFPAHTPGLRRLVDWLRQCGVTTVALEASGVYGHVLFLTLLEAGFTTVMTAPAFTRQIKGRPKTDRLDCQWIQRLHKHGLLPPIFQPDEATQTLRGSDTGQTIGIGQRVVVRLAEATPVTGGLTLELLSIAGAALAQGRPARGKFGPGKRSAGKGRDDGARRKLTRKRR